MKSCLKGFIIFLIFAFILSACTPNTSGTSSPTPVSTSIEVASTTSETYGSLAGAAFMLYNSNCSGCHGSEGRGVQGPPIRGPQAKLAKYNTAAGLLDFMSNAMPYSSPGLLTHQDYLDILCYLVIHDTDQVSGNAAFDENQLASVKLK